LHHFLALNDRVQQLLSRLLAGFLLLMAVLTVTVVALRYGFNLGTVALQESIMYLHAAVFMLGAGVALGRDSHVRVDILYQNLRPRNQHWVNAVGTLVFLLPFSLVVGISSWEYVSESWSIFETSAESEGIPAVYLLKTLIPLSMATLALQGLSLFITSAHHLVHGGADG
jgi:TRAP-type mannitol/chloroaromatic compound transport system permease small subunit